MVLDLGARSVGSVVKEGEQMVTLVALDVPLGIDAAVDPKDIGYLRVGDTVRIKLEPFPYQKYGTLEGVIQSINGDVTEHEEAGRKLSAYKVRIVMTRNDLRGVPADVALLPGMMSTCEIKVGTRRLITYFLYPIIRTFDSGLREP
jgi:HlyD family secretion protein